MEKYVLSADPDQWAVFVKELEAAEVEYERLDERSVLCHAPADFSAYFLQHRFPVAEEFLLADDGFDAIAALKPEFDFQDISQKRYAFQLAANRKLDWSFGSAIEAWIKRWGLPEGGRDDRSPEIVFSLYLHSSEQVRMFLGVSKADHNVSPWNRGVCRIPRSTASVSRAESKLQEALELLGPQAQASGNALDLGAAPGGWSRVLAELGFRVTAVDPAALDERVAGLPQVEHYATTAGDFLSKTEALYDLVVSDMKMDPVMVAELMTRGVERLKPSGFIVATLKLPRKGSPLAKIERAMAEIRRAYTVVQARQLYFNRHEVTVLGRPRVC